VHHKKYSSGGGVGVCFGICVFWSGIVCEKKVGDKKVNISFMGGVRDFKLLSLYILLWCLRISLLIYFSS
jgi:hypothetical protein